MVYFIHGQNQVDSRRFLIKLKSSYDDIQTINGIGLKKADLQRKFQEASRLLFGGKSAFLIEDFAGDEELLDLTPPPQTDLIAWASKKTAVRSKNLKNFLFDRVDTTNSFKLADAVLLKGEAQSQIILQRLMMAKEPAEKIIGAISRGLALCMAAKDGSLETAKISDFIKQKSSDLAKNWSRPSIRAALLLLLQADVSIKRGTNPLAAISYALVKITRL